MSDNPIEIVAQCMVLKNLAASGGWRFSLDLFNARPQDVAVVALLVNEQKNVKVTIEPIEKGPEAEQGQGKKGKRSLRKAGSETQ